MVITDVGCRASPGHVIRCVVGSSLRFIVWVSLANVAAAATGRTKGFWAAKVGWAPTAVLLLRPKPVSATWSPLVSNVLCFIEQRLIRT